ncbi:sal-like protein 1 [Carassius gibelio]|uniref:sal-like protein 1 n=1 Tax=Carassius gibelio TaxID=101364 RepID=UPI00227788DD|nr:sal-like protein 1 [Carassius gibelio]
MSRRKQKRPQQLVNADPGGTRLMPQDDQLPVKSPSTSLASEATSSSSSSSPTSLQDCQPPLAPRPSPGGLHAPSLPNESSSPPHWPNHIASYSTSLPNAHSSLSPDFPHPSLSSQTHSPPPSQQKSTHIPSHQPHSTVMSPPMGISATTTTSSSSSLSSSSSMGAPPHQGSPSPIHQTPSSPSEQLQVPPTLAVLLEELRVLQQRQIHQMQITEEICRQVLRLGGMVSAQDAPQGSVEGQQSDAGSSSPPNTVSGASLITQAPTTKSNIFLTNGTRAPYSTTSSSTSSSSLVTSSASVHPLSLTLGLPPRYLNEKSPNTSISHGNGMNFPAPPLPTVSLSHDQLFLSSTVSTSNGSSSSSSGRQQHTCRFCGKVLSSDSSLQIHLRSHTGERPYQCPVCLSRFTTRGNLKAHFLRHREQNPELSLSLLPPALSEQSQSGSGSGPSQRRRKRRAEDEETFGVKGSVGVPDSLALGFLSGSSHPSPSSLPLPPSVDLALLSTAHSLLQLNRASAAAAASVSTSVQSSSSSITSSAMTGQFKGTKQQRFDENTPPHSTLHPGSPYSQLAHLPKILFPSGPSAHHPSLALLRPPHLPSPHLSLTFPFSSYPKPQNSSPTSSSPSSSSVTSDTSKLQRLAQKLEKMPLPKSTNEGHAHTNDISTTSSANAISAYRREMMAALGLNPSPSSEPASQELQGSTASSLVPNQCGVCLRVLSCPRALRLHQATHLGERPFPCKLCGRSFSTKGSLRAHLATHRARPANARGQNSCPLCQRKFTNAVVLQHHIRMHLGGQLPPEGNGDLQSEEDPGHMDGITLPKNLQSLPLNMSMSSSASLLESEASLRDATSGDADQLMESDQDPYDNTPETSPAVTLEKEDLLGENSPADNSVPADENHYGTVHHSKSPIVSGSAEEDEETPLSLCTRTNSQDTLFDTKWLNGTSHQSVITGPNPNLNSEALSLSPALTPPSSTGLSTDSKSDQSSKQTTLHVNGIDRVLDPSDGDSHPAIENDSLHIPDRAVEQKVKAEDAQESAEEDQRKDREKSEGTSSETLVAPPQPQRSEKPYSCTECGKEYASRSGLKGHMKIHSGSMNQVASSTSSQSFEGIAVERTEESTHRKLRGEDAKNKSEESTDKLSLTAHPVSTTDRDDRPEDTA